jgi:SAM-dependent methyltransferase
MFNSLRNPYTPIRCVLRFLRTAYGFRPRECNICKYKGRFYTFGMPGMASRLDALCPSCECLERHRLLVLADQECHFFTNKKVLHFAPEHVLRQYIRSCGAMSYITADLYGKNVDITQDIENITLEDGSYDVVIASHVLEHVNDRKALKELHRILKPGGIALLMVPIVEGWDNTYEDSKIVSTEERQLYYGQSDHIRFYGRDFRTRITNSGFALQEFTAVEPLVSRYALVRGEKLFIATKE